MTFSTATIQGYVTYMKSSETPGKRVVMNMLVSVPDKRENQTRADTYKVSVWDAQAIAAAQYISAERKQVITISGTLRLDEYSVQQGKPMMRLDFASILDYGNTKPTQEQISDKQKFANMIETIDEAKLAAEVIKREKKGGKWNEVYNKLKATKEEAAKVKA